MRITSVSSATLKAQANLQQATGKFAKSVENLASGGGSEGFAQAVVNLKTSEVAAKASTKALKILLDTEEELIGALLDKRG